jgi:hypothetical protein
LSALKAGSTLGAAVGTGEQASAHSNAAEVLTTLIGDNIAVALNA